MTIKEEVVVRAQAVHAYLEQCLRGRNIPGRLLESMEYSLLAGGKRLRPVLLLNWAELFGLQAELATPFAAGLECIHTYSLIHDDLPAMDDDDLRRGRPSNHKAFDEATAILAGDGLLTEAFTLMFSSPLPAERVLKAAACAAEAAGGSGMVGGQMLDMLYTGKGGASLEELRRMHSMKTGALIKGACTAGAILAGASEEDVSRAEHYGRSVGVAFQIVDDILDVIGDEAELGKPVGSDEEMGKSTYPSLVGLDESKRLAEEYAAEARHCLECYHGPQAEFLKKLADYIVHRIN
ncbi:MAG: polyprenyl synthetase family protein [Desulfovibrionaceae bacterium]|jgi:geranylgeranyl diphosphate synthase type II